MVRQVLLGVAAAALIVAPAQPSAAQQPVAKVLIVDVPGTTLDDWLAADAPELHRILRQGQTGLMSARTASSLPLAGEPCYTRRLDAAIATMTNGSRSAAGLRFDDPTGPVAQSALQQAIIGVPAPITMLHIPYADATFPTGTRTNLDKMTAFAFSQTGPVVVAEIDDALRADCTVPAGERDRWVRLALHRADALIGFAGRIAESGGDVVVVSSVPPRARERGRNLLTVAAVFGSSTRAAGLLTSATTRRAGIVSIDDVAPTVASMEQAGTRIGDGHVWHATPGGVAALRAKEAGLDAAARNRSPLYRVFVWSSCALILAAIVVVLSGRAGAARGALGVGLTAIVLVPAAGLLQPLTGVHGPGGALTFVFGSAIGAAALLRAVMGPRAAIPFAAAITLAVVAGDLAAGAPLAARSPVSYTLAEGARFYGIGNELMGVLVACAVVWAAAALDRTAPPVVPVAVVLGVVAAMMAAPPVGAKFGAAFVAVPAFGIVVARGAGAELRSSVTVVAIAVATVLLSGAAVAWDFASRSHTHVAALASAGAHHVLSRKAGAALRLLAGSYWTAGLIAGAGAVAFVAWRRPALTGRALWGRPALRAAIVAAGVACIAAVAFDDAGVEAASLIALVVAAATAHAMLVENRG